MRKMLLIVIWILFMAAGAAAQLQTFTLAVNVTESANVQSSAGINTDASTRVTVSVTCTLTPKIYEVVAPSPVGVLTVSCTEGPGVSISSAATGFNVSVKVVSPPVL